MTAGGLNYEPYPWQQYVFDTALEVDPDTGLLVYGTVILSTPRQQGKTKSITTLATHRCLAWPGQVVTYAAQTRDHARLKLQDDHEPMLAVSDFFDRYTFVQTNGFERLKWDNGSVWGIGSTTKKSGHGPTLDMGMADEAWAHTDARIDQAWLPATMTRPNAQIWILSTAGKSAEESPWFWDKVETGREAVEQGLQTDVAHFEWGALPDDDPDDPDTWWGCMPALGYGGITEGKIRAARRALLKEPGEFERGYLNLWNDESATPSVIDMDKFGGCADEWSRHGSVVALSVTASVDHKWAAICMAGYRQDGRVHAEVIEHRAGLPWVVARLVQLIARWRPVGVGLDLGGPAGHLHLAMDRAGLRMWKPTMSVAEARGKLLTAPTVREAAQACAALYELIESNGLRWLGPAKQPVLMKAAAGAKTKPLGDAWAWARRGSADISTLDGITLAAWVLAVRGHAYDQQDYDVAQSVF